MLMNPAAQWVRDKRAFQQHPSTGSSPSSPSSDDPPELDHDLGEAPIEFAVETGQQKSKKGRKRSKKRADSSQGSESEDSDATTHDSSTDSEEDIPPRPTLGRKTSYELEREKNIARNQALLEATFGKDLEAFHAEIGKGAKGKGTGKGAKGKDKGKDNVDERSGEGRVTRSKAKENTSNAQTTSAATSTIPPPADSISPLPPVPPADLISSLPPDDSIPPLPQPPLTNDRATSRSPTPEPGFEGEPSLHFESADEPLLGAPEWVTEAMEWLKDDSLGEEWALCVRTWWYFEKVVGGFATGVRPSHLSI
jgi:hypothetical protein